MPFSRETVLQLTTAMPFRHKHVVMFPLHEHAFVGERAFNKGTEIVWDYSFHYCNLNTQSTWILCLHEVHTCGNKAVVQILLKHQTPRRHHKLYSVRIPVLKRHTGTTVGLDYTGVNSQSIHNIKYTITYYLYYLFWKHVPYTVKCSSLKLAHFI